MHSRSLFIVCVLAFATSARAAEPPPVLADQWGEGGSGPGQFDDPWSIAVDDDGSVFVADNRNARIQKFAADGTYVTEFPLHEPTSRTRAGWEPLWAVSIYDGEVFVGDDNASTVQVFSTDGTFLREWPSTGIPFGLAVSSHGVYVTDSVNFEIFQYTPAGSLITSWVPPLRPYGANVNADEDLYVAAETGVLKYTSDGQFIAQYGHAGSNNGQFLAAYCVSVDADGNMYVTDWANERVQKLRYDGLYLSQWPVPLAVGVAVGTTGQIYVGHRNEIQIYEYVVGVEPGTWAGAKALYRTGP